MKTQKPFSFSGNTHKYHGVTDPLQLHRDHGSGAAGSRGAACVVTLLLGEGRAGQQHKDARRPDVMQSVNMN